MTTTIHFTADNFNGSPDFFNYRDPLPDHLQGMTQDKWDSFTAAQCTAMCDTSHLTPQLIGLEGRRVRAVDIHDNARKFYVGKSTGWRPCHLEIKTSRSMDGSPARSKYKSVEVIS